MFKFEFDNEDEYFTTTMKIDEETEFDQLFQRLINFLAGAYEVSENMIIGYMIENLANMGHIHNGDEIDDECICPDCLGESEDCTSEYCDCDECTCEDF